jgi:hypothetical protein
MAVGRTWYCKSVYNSLVDCELCRTLKAENHRTETESRLAHAALQVRTPTAGAAEYNSLRATAAAAGIDEDLARMELEKHKLRHIRAN